MNLMESLRQCYKHFLFPSSEGRLIAAEWQKLSAQLLDLATSSLLARDSSLSLDISNGR